MLSKIIYLVASVFFAIFLYVYINSFIYIYRLVRNVSFSQKYSRKYGAENHVAIRCEVTTDWISPCTDAIWSISGSARAAIVFNSFGNKLWWMSELKKTLSSLRGSSVRYFSLVCIYFVLWVYMLNNMTLVDYFLEINDLRDPKTW